MEKAFFPTLYVRDQDTAVYSFASRSAFNTEIAKYTEIEKLSRAWKQEINPSAVAELADGTDEVGSHEVVVELPAVTISNTVLSFLHAIANADICLDDPNAHVGTSYQTKFVFNVKIDVLVAEEGTLSSRVIIKITKKCRRPETDFFKEYVYSGGA